MKRFNEHCNCGSDEDVYRVKIELALGYLKEYQDFYDKKHGNE